MSIIAGYSSGRVSVVKGANQVTGVDTAWLAGAIREGDYLWINGLTVKIASVIDNTNLVLAFPWPGASVTESIYEIRYTHDSQRVLSSSRDLINKMNQGGLAPIGPLIPVAGGMIHYVNSNNAEIIISGAKGRSLLQTENIQQAQANLELIPQSNLIDATINRLLKTGSFGLGAINAPLLDNIDRSDIPAGFYKVDKTITLGTRPPLSDVADSLIVLHPTPSQTTQIYLGMTENGRNYIRKGNSTSSWSPWRSIVLDFESGTGSGSNLDADMLDGYHAADFVLRSELGQGSLVDLIKDSDGAGSGLDADLLDGLHAEAFGRLSQASSWSAMQSFNEVVRVSASAHEQIQLGYGKTGINPTLSFYSNTTQTGFIQDGAGAGLVIASGAGGQLLISGSGVVNINGKQLATKEYIDNQISGLGNDPDFVENINNQIATKLDISAYTAQDVLNKIKTVDGTGSGLDADTLDGISSGSFVRNDLNTAQIIINTFTATNYSNVKAAALNTDTAGYTIYNENNIEQFRLYWERSSNTTYLRNRNNDDNGWHNLAISGNGSLSFNGNIVYHAGNINQNTELNAAFLNGRDSSYFQKNLNSIAAIELGSGLGSNGHRHIDFISDGSASTDYNARIIRYTGSNGNFIILQSGAGDIELNGGGALIRNGSMIWHSGNDGHNSGLDADTLDGLQGSYYLDPANLSGRIDFDKLPTNLVTSSINIVAGNGLSGGGNLTASRSISLGTPSSITSTSTNSVTNSSHTHELPNSEIAKIIAAIYAGSIGSYSLLRYLGSTDVGVGQTVAGSSLLYTNASGSSSGSYASGTWRAMSRISLGTNEDRTALFLRVA